MLFANQFDDKEREEKGPIILKTPKLSINGVFLCGTKAPHLVVWFKEKEKENGANWSPWGHISFEIEMTEERRMGEVCVCVCVGLGPIVLMAFFGHECLLLLFFFINQSKCVFLTLTIYIKKGT